MADEDAAIRGSLEAVRASAARLSEACARCAEASGAAESQARSAQSLPSAQTSTAVMRWTGLICDWARQAADSSTTAVAQAGRVAAAAAVAPNDPAIAERIRAVRESARAAAALPAGARAQLATAREWASMAAEQTIVEEEDDLRGLLAKVLESIEAAIAAAKGAADVAAVLAAAMETLVAAIRASEQDDGPDDRPMSTLDIRALRPTVDEGDHGPDTGEALVFVVARSGPLARPCSVQWVKSGTTDVTDFTAGTEFAGVLIWDAGDGRERRIELVLSPDRITETDKTTIVTLREATGALIGRASAKAELRDDDPAPSPSPQGYDESLPFGGLGIGTAILLGQPGNQRVVTESSIMIRCEKTGAIDRLQWNNRFNGHGRTGYSTGSGGVISWRLRKVADSNARPVVPGPVVAETARISDPIEAEPWREEFTAAGGQGDIGNFNEYPTIRFRQPAEVRKDEMLLLTLVQHDSGRGTVSINNAFSSARVPSDWSPYPYHRSARQFRGESLSRTRPEHFPLILLGYTDGTVKGTGAMGYAAGMSQEAECIVLGQGVRARQVITVPPWIGSRTIRRVHSFWARYSPEPDGDLRCRICLAGADPMGRRDDGSPLAEAAVDARSIPFKRDIKGPRDPVGPVPFIRHDFARSPVRLSRGQVIYVELGSTGGTTRYIGNRMVRWLGYAEVGLRYADWALRGMGAQVDDGDGWQPLTVSNVKQDLGLWCEF